MRKILLLVSLSITSLVSSQVTLGQIDDFEDYTMRNWAKNNTIPNANIYNDGPLGVDDNFLRVTSSGSGNNLNLMTFNNAQWIGNYYRNNLSNRIKYISMDVRNSGENIIFLRISFGRASSYTENWSAINAVAVLPGEGWKKVNFYLEASDFVRISGLSGTSPDFSGAFSNIGEFRILHNDTPAWDSDPIVATLDIDNIQASSQPLLNNESFENKPDLILFPNPANENIVIYNTNNIVDTFSYKIIDLQGRIIKNGNSKINEKINVENLSAGNYIIQINTDNGLTTNRKFIKK